MLLVASTFTSVSAQQSDSTKAASVAKVAKSRRGQGTKIVDFPMIPKGEWLVGIEAAHVTLNSNDSEWLLLLDNFTARYSTTTLSPVVGWFYSDNNCVGIKFRYANASGTLTSASVPIEGLDLDISDVAATRKTYSVGVFQRSYVSLDSKGRFGLFNDTELMFVGGRSTYGDPALQDSQYTLSHELKLTFNPGLVVFTTKNISAHCSIGVGGLSYAHYRNFTDGIESGERKVAKANLKLSIADIKMGIVVHLW